MGRLLVYAVFVLALLAVSKATHFRSPAYYAYCSSVLTANQPPRTCLELLCRGARINGVYTIHPAPFQSFDVYCDQTTDGGGWTVFQRRMDGSVDFYRNWDNYKLGFGDANGEFWLGNDRLSQVLALHSNNELRIDMKSVGNSKVYAKYSVFGVGNESTKYQLEVAGYHGTAGNSMGGHNGSKFSTKDYDNDVSSAHCATVYHGAWWYTDCHVSNLNGAYLNGKHKSFANGVNWQTWKGYLESLKATEMKFRAKL